MADKEKCQFCGATVEDPCKELLPYICPKAIEETRDQFGYSPFGLPHREPAIVPGHIISYSEMDEESQKDWDAHMETQRRIFGK